MISQRYWIDKNTPLPLQNSIMNNTVWEKMLSCWRFLGNKDAFLASCHKSIFFPPLSLLATLSSLISSSTKYFSSLASSCMLELPLRKPWGFNKYPTTLYSLCQTVCTGEEKKINDCYDKLSFLTLVLKIKREIPQNNPAMSSPTEISINLVKQRAAVQIEWHLSDILCAIWFTCCCHTFSFEIY